MNKKDTTPNLFAPVVFRTVRSSTDCFDAFCIRFHRSSIISVSQRLLFTPIRVVPARTGIVFAAIVCVAIQAAAIVYVFFDPRVLPQGVFWIWMQGTSISSPSGYVSEPMWEGKFISHVDKKPPRSVFLGVSEINAPDAIKRIQFELPNDDHHSIFQLRTFGERAWIVREQGEHLAFELVGDKLIPATEDAVPPEIPNRWWGRRNCEFEINGTPAWIDNTTYPIGVHVLDKGKWNLLYNVDLSDILKPGFLKNPVTIPPGSYSICCVPHAGKIHSFVELEGYVFYREGLPLVPVANLSGNSIDPPLSPIVAGTKSETTWSLVRNDPFRLRYEWGRFDCMTGLIVDGKPAAAIIDSMKLGYAPTNLYHLENREWREIARTDLPLGTFYLRTILTPDGKKSYLTTSTALANGSIFSVDRDGIHHIKTDANWRHHLLHYLPINFRDFRENQLDALTAIVGGTGILANLAFAMFMMLWAILFQSPQYQFGKSNVRLASICLRCVARTIDLSLILVGAIYLAWHLLLNRHLDFDWQTFDEARNLGVGHPVVMQYYSYWGCIASWIVFSFLGLAYLQGRWGVTPGKWICGLKTVQTTLRPCGFARALAREIILSVDLFCGLSLIPGLFSIGFSDKRQRFGDRVADTIVICRWQSRTDSLSEGTGA